MKITKRQLKRIIKEELKIVKRENNRLNEARVDMAEAERALITVALEEIETPNKDLLNRFFRHMFNFELASDYTEIGKVLEQLKKKYNI